MNWVDAAINAAVSFAFGVPAGFVISRRARRAGFALGRALGFEEGRLDGLREANRIVDERLGDR